MEVLLLALVIAIAGYRAHRRQVPSQSLSGNTAIE
jgi:hypothetical protein